MGVSASGKSSVAAGLSAALGLEWLDADDLHPAANVAKMAAGIPLTDDDRWPWLDRVGEGLARGAARDGVVIACSGLRRVYRDRLRSHVPRAAFVHLTGSPELLAERAAARTDHFMPASLLASQLALLEPLEPDERGVEIDVDAPVTDIVEKAERWMESHGG
jgi:carbohydrate kinase (thermoresistant glucokinase family)